MIETPFSESPNFLYIFTNSVITGLSFLSCYGGFSGIKLWK